MRSSDKALAQTPLPANLNLNMINRSLSPPYINTYICPRTDIYADTHTCILAIYRSMHAVS